MIEKVLILILPLVFLGVFIARNLIVKARAQKSIRSRDRLATASIILSTACILMTILSVYSDPFYRLTGALFSFLFYHVFQPAVHPAQPVAAGADPGCRDRLSSDGAKEERYLLGIHGNEYEAYKNNAGRYLPRLK